MNPKRLILCGLILTAATFATTSTEAVEAKDCPVCFSIVEKLKSDIAKEGGKLDIDNVSQTFLHLCDTADKNSVESKFCYYMGGQDVSATRTYKLMAEKIASGFPTEKICDEISKKDQQICEIRERKPVDLKTVDLKKLKVADLKRILRDRGEACEHCFEKSEFINKIEEIKAREEL